jgi:serine/threonine-protein phosphatase 4 regulatory subunit 1
VFEVFVNDEAELVRQAVAAALPQLVKRTESLEERRTFAVEGLSALYNAGQSCRCAAMEVLGELIYAFHDDPLGPPEELVGIYKDDSDEQEVFAGDCDWDIIAAYNVSFKEAEGADDSSLVYASLLDQIDGPKFVASFSDYRKEVKNKS